MSGARSGQDKPAQAHDGDMKTPDNAGPQGSLLTVLVERYDHLRRRLVRRLGSTERAEDALQDTYLRLKGTEAVSEIQNPVAYLFRAAFNTALNLQRAENRRLNAGEIEALLHIADEAPDAVRIIEGRSDILKLKEIMAKLPARQRAILLAARLDGLSRLEIANRFGISVSMVEKELRRAQEFCVSHFGRTSGG
jgi:RNA polymerase sigma-70 factor, ECF subfamily